MAKVLGFGGLFFKSPDPARLYAWYREHLGFDLNDWGASLQPAAMPEGGYTVWSAFADTSDYFAPSEKGFMFNLVVDDLAEALAQVQRAGARIVKPSESHEFGHFGWFIDPDGNKVELWQPTAEAR